MKNILFVYNISIDDNEFVELHVSLLSKLGYNVVTSVAEFWNPSINYDFIVINWPEALFDWSFRGSDRELLDLVNRFNQFSASKSKIIFFLHDEYSNSLRSTNFNLVFDICYRKSDVFIHLGGYSYNKYSFLFSNAKHYIMPHPLYVNFNFDLDYQDCRFKLGIQKSEFFIIVPGSIRNLNEIDYCVGILKKLSIKKKKMVFLRSRFYLKPEKLVSYNHFKSWVYYLLKKNYYLFTDNITFLGGFMPPSQMSEYFAAADLIIIPRLQTLNSGNITLAAQFGKNMVGSGSGNMKEFLEELNQNVITHNDKEVADIRIEPSTDLRDKISTLASNEYLANKWKSILLENKSN